MSLLDAVPKYEGIQQPVYSKVHNLLRIYHSLLLIATMQGAIVLVSVCIKERQSIIARRQNVLGNDTSEG